jgi:hypothetical protein
MQPTLMLTAFLLPGILVTYWLIADWIKERTLRRRWASQPLLSKAIKQRAREAQQAPSTPPLGTNPRMRPGGSR